MDKYLIGQKVILNDREIGEVVEPETNGFNSDDYVWVMSPSKGYSSAYAKHNVKPYPNPLLRYCHVCGVETEMFCKKTPSGGWGSIKCGRPICEDCKCDCDEGYTW